jgi:hypothetical protein
MNKTLVLFPLALLAACGIPGDTLLLDLDEKDAELICKRAVDEDAEDRVVSCEAGDVTLPASTMDECLEYFAAVLTVNSPDCDATLDNWVDCKEEPELTDDQVCGVEEMPAPSENCIKVVTCITPATGTTPTM